jgi:cation:H+ antiporter
MSLILDLLITVVCIFGLWWGAVWIVEASVRIAKRLGMSELVIGLTLVAIGTSAPEFAVTVAAALHGHADISVGNVVGSNIFNLGFILGGVAFIRPITTSRALVFRDGTVLIGATFLLLLFLSNLTLVRWEGLVLIGLLIVYIIFLIARRPPLEEEIPTGEFHWYEIPRLIAGLGLVVVSGHFLVVSASNLARTFGVSEWAIGVTIVAAGTSAPELATSLVAAWRGRHGISTGNLIGSDIFNLLGVLGVAATLRSMTVDNAAYDSIFLLCGMVVLVVMLMRTGWKITRVEGAALVFINFIRWAADFTQ